MENIKSCCIVLCNKNKQSEKIKTGLFDLLNKLIKKENVVNIYFYENNYHETYIKLDEKGAEVAAVTGDLAYTSSGIILPEFKLDRPFIFMINETSTNACILAGRISKFK